jgi:microcystin-dependent protein
MSQSMSFTTGWIGGSYEHKLTKEELPPHYHTLLDIPSESGSAISGNSNDELSYARITERADSTKKYWISKTTEEGSGHAHNNMQPWIAVLFWRRVS